MKKLLALLIAALCLPACAFNPAEKVNQDNFYRVECICENGFIAQNSSPDKIFVKYPQTDQFEEYDTVYIEFDESDLIPGSGTYSDSYGYEISYSYVLENPKTVRLAGPGEPTYA